MSKSTKKAEKKAAKKRTPASQETATATPRKMGVLDAAAKVLAEAGKPMNAKAMVETALAKGYWKTSGKTPWATLYTAVTMLPNLAA